MIAALGTKWSEKHVISKHTCVHRFSEGTWPVFPLLVNYNFHEHLPSTAH